ncbi:hypothetical protein PROFUN_10259 [Planoprotostelium fungivorum]|uniref:Uncharacterized protein n=1 Tax=Planoprotostelium fungivorum TaxID=1890364 RepID=A0A2P6NEJ5_9EUKA|nr:hypothetical protein PROFUN_10259 [Planoprotostelium fungivorum]
MSFRCVKLDSSSFSCPIPSSVINACTCGHTEALRILLADPRAAIKSASTQVGTVMLLLVIAVWIRQRNASGRSVS